MNVTHNAQPNLLRRLYFKDTSFVELMNKRIYNVLLIAGKYDLFAIEEDGRIDEQIFNEYVALNLRYPPRFMHCTSVEEATGKLSYQNFELILNMRPETGPALEHFLQEKNLTIPHFYLIKPDSPRIEDEPNQFVWTGNTDLLLAIIKMVEDRMNVEEDTKSTGVQSLVILENEPDEYSALLPRLYNSIFEQSKAFKSEALNEHQQMLRMRGRPKVVLTRNSHEALQWCKEHPHNLLGFIGNADLIGIQSGKTIIDTLRQRDPYLPVYITYKGDYLKKSFQKELNTFISDELGFGDLIFKDPVSGERVLSVSSLKDLQYNLDKIPDESLIFHIRRNDISKWLYSRAMFPLAEFLKSFDYTDAVSPDTARQIIEDAIVQYRKIKNQGIVAEFKRDRFDKYSNFARVGQGSMGGKGRGLAFLDALIKRNPEFIAYDQVIIAIPKTVVLCTDIFDEFMESNNLYQVALSDSSDQDILDAFINARLPRRLVADFVCFFDAIEKPIAVRSSSLLEDSHYQPFAGVYSTYMIPNLRDDKKTTLSLLATAIKSVYASVYYKDSKTYMSATSNVIDHEKMAIVIQEVCGDEHENRFYPTFSGVARSINFYPIGNESAEDGVANVALGLGKYIVDGGITLRFSPKHPHNILQMSSLDISLRETQTKFYALDLNNRSIASTDDACNLSKHFIKQAETDDELWYLASTFDPIDQLLRDGCHEGGRKIISFANILQHESFPLAEILCNALHIGEHEMGLPVEIEFAANLGNRHKSIKEFQLLQIRPIVENREEIPIDLKSIDPKETIIYATDALGNGAINGVFDLIYVRPEAFNPIHNSDIAEQISILNSQLISEHRPYVLIGPGRWGSSDPWLGIPVKWAQIAGAKMIVEAGLTNYRIEPSQGTHFFQNLTSLRVSYLTINSYIGEGYYDVDALNATPAYWENDYIRLIRFEKELCLLVDGKKNLAVVSTNLTHNL